MAVVIVRFLRRSRRDQEREPIVRLEADVKALVKVTHKNKPDAQDFDRWLGSERSREESNDDSS